MPVWKQSHPACQVCNDHVSRYRCPACTVRYCSVPCFKEHKLSACHTSSNEAGPSTQSMQPSLPEVPATSEQHELIAMEETSTRLPEVQKRSLKPLTALLWPPEPDESIFTDPLRRDDPKPLRQEELLRIATSPQLRHLLSATSLPQILRLLDAIPSPHARSSSLSRLLGLDPESLGKPTSDSLLSQRDSPPPLDELLNTLVGVKEENTSSWHENGWWLGQDGKKEGRIWIGEEEKKIMRLFAGVVCQAIDGSEGDEVAWGDGSLAWEV